MTGKLIRELHRARNTSPALRCQEGAAILIITLILLTAAVTAVVYSAVYVNILMKTAANQNSSEQAFEAAEAGLQYGVAYLQTNSSTVTGSPSGGYINYSLAKTTLGNNSSFVVTYTNPTANNYQLLEVSATGTSADGSATRTVKQQVYSGSSALQYAVTTQGNLTASGIVTITGTNGVDVGGSITTSGIITISSEKQNDTALAGETGSSLFSGIFGMSESQMQSQATYYSNTSGINWSSLSGDVWINSGVVLAGTYTIGTVANPVLLIVNGNFVASGTITINGILYVTGSTTTSGAVTVNGGLVSQGAVTMSGTSAAYNSAVVSHFSSSTFGLVPGSWKDF